jgi:hypothetical protein
VAEEIEGKDDPNWRAFQRICHRVQSRENQLERARIFINFSRKISEKEDFIYFLLLEQCSDFASALKLCKV